MLILSIISKIIITLIPIFSALILTIIILIAMGTIFHMVHLKKSNDELTGMLPQVLVAFSIIANLKKLCGPAHEDSLNLNCISGIKFMAMGFIVAGHCLVFVVGGPMLHKKFWADVLYLNLSSLTSKKNYLHIK